MSRRTLWTTFTLISMIMGAIAGSWLAGNYVTNLGVKGGRFLGFSVDAGTKLINEDGSLTTEGMLAKIAFVIGGLLIGFLASTIIHTEMQRLKRGIETMSAQDKIAVVSGLLIGLTMTVLIGASIQQLNPIAKFVIAVILCYIGITAALSMREQIRMYFPGSMSQSDYPAMNAVQPKILDTNVIIDGRIADVCKAGFVEGPIYIPRFVLEELQQIADSSDSLKRARGRRGLDILKQMQQEVSLSIETYEYGGGGRSEDVDGRLVELAKEISGAIVTNDYNLNKVAALQGVKVLNVNELANALKPVVLPGEEMKVAIIKEGKEQNQGVGYLDDGTMIVVEHAKRMIGETMDVVVTSVLQTPAGKMIFADMKSDEQGEDSTIERNIRTYTSGRQRRKIR